MADMNQNREAEQKKEAGCATRHAARREVRRAAREAVFALLFETEYHPDEQAEDILARAVEDRDIPTEEDYVRNVYLGIMAHRDEVDERIGRHAKGWRTNRLSRVSRAILRLGAYELMFVKSTPTAVAINEAVELSKKFDDPKARAFINGVLNAIKNELAEGAKAEQTLETADDEA
jgi:N utilization substance protein B